MPRGPTPKEESKRTRRNPPTFPPIELEAGRKLPAPKLPNARRYSVATRAWYRTWAGSPQAAQFLPTDWQRLHMVALLVEALFKTEDAKLAKELLGEIRLQEAKLGATPEDRLRLRWRMRETDEDEEPAEKQAKRKSSRRRVDPRLRLVEGSGGA